MPSNAFGALRHIDEPVSLFRWRFAGRNKAFAIVFNCNFNGIIGGFGLDANFVRLGVFECVRQCFLHDEKNVVTDIGR